MDVNFALEDYEVARGFILACQSYPVTDKVIVDFDQTGTGERRKAAARPDCFGVCAKLLRGARAC